MRSNFRELAGLGVAPAKKKGPTVFGWVPDPPASSPPHSLLGSRTCQVRSPAVE